MIARLKAKLDPPSTCSAALAKEFEVASFTKTEIEIVAEMTSIVSLICKDIDNGDNIQNVQNLQVTNDSENGWEYKISGGPGQDDSSPGYYDGDDEAPPAYEN